ncbi:phosphatidate cytidylyltransferase [Wohlfahrtiimonas chitiniclastica]|uniref:phosphatidate cytidylyltransferase n=1 Tax=Wohlfahrtiimonas chitiniclastica TaxID=400946 RepID=UPI001BCA864B|nr:phosphatidate cytidylyltransferase [Wohlfahrtiimonas chitiniclastica]MBS7817655.1 phosphatidate cytidylyltransferase [Wohlfahrtiimonas chitiniclastica]MBS7823507.1 phosphatidate cytidylyltransferase [Wohlfahrtiimonas chitiniclastica]MBS7831321.1 phosphatidate cytidylyltransferase [Wohlfahrtiimonas chitiniclastica]MBS7833288.1 phosphatidate cytidylyltransferase [Wohlfahrtiimonas chitiniclastica]
MAHLLPHSFHMIIALFALLSVASLIVWLKCQRQKGQHNELAMRTQSWWWMIIIVVGALYLGQKAITILFALMSFLALKEFFSITPMRAVDRRLVFWAYLAIPLQYYFAYVQWYGMFIILIPVYLFLLLPMRSVLIGETDGFIKANATIQWSLMLCVFAFSHIAYLANLDRVHPAAGFAGLILYLLFITQFNDVSQYVCGKLWGRHKIIPKVSPNKTWEGFIGGLIVTTLLSTCLAPYLTILTWQQGLMAGIVLAISGFIGDVVLSSVKRDLGIKDSGALIPGHGGILDRIDSLMYTAPLFFHYFYFVTKGVV